MSNVITVENLGKKYLLNHQAQRGSYVALRDVIADGAKSFARRVTGARGPGAGREEFWALRDVSFEVKQGDRIGIIGRNGAGKSTLLKILSRITEPTTGTVRMRGRIASLLEVGTGFHPELTGRENIFLNGAILGMSRTEIRKNFDAIVDFAEVEKFLDTPVKRYSSGMYVRLAFAVAAHLDPEILVVDEVLAVGDLAFQKKCISKMEEVSAEGGRTVLFVSHNMQMVMDLCNRGILLEGGKVAGDGAVSDVIESYITSGVEAQSGARRDLRDPEIRTPKISNPNSAFKWEEILIYNSKQENSNEMFFGEPFQIVMRGRASERCENIRIGVAIISRRFGMVCTTHQHYSGLPDHLEPGLSEYRIAIDPNYLVPGHYSIGIAAGETMKVADYITEDAISFSVLNAPYFPNRQWNPVHQGGAVFFPCAWTLKNGEGA